MNQFSKRLKDTINASGLTQGQLAARVNVSRTAISDYCNGNAMPSLAVFAKICKELDESADYLLGLKTY